MPSHGNELHRRNSLKSSRLNTRSSGQKPRKSSNNSEITNDHLPVNRSVEYGDNRVPPPSSSNMQLCTSPMSSPCRRPRTDQDEEDECFTVVTNKRRKNQDKISNLDDNRDCTRNDVVGRDVLVDVLQQPPLLSSTTDVTNIQPKLIEQTQQRNYQSCYVISDDATRYAQSRFPFPPFTIRFTAGNVNEKQVAQDVVDNWKKNRQVEVAIIHVRRSTMKCLNKEYDFLIYVKDAGSFCALSSSPNWPKTIGGECYTFPSLPSFPPQLSIIIKNVDLRIDSNEISANLKMVYPDIHNVIRLKNRSQYPIKLIKVEILSVATRDEIISSGRLSLNGITYEVEEYLAPASVLICSKCMGIGHFKKQCKQILTTCKVCGSTCTDTRDHNCSLICKCIHCGGDHFSNALKCPVVKNYRADLTKKLLGMKTSATYPPTSQSSINFTNYNYDPANFPPLPSAPRWSINSDNTNPMIMKFEELFTGMSKLNIALEKIVRKNDQLEQFLVDTSDKIDALSTKVNDLNTFNKNIEKVLSQHEVKLTRHDNLFSKLVLPMLDEISSFMASLNVGKHGSTLDADFKVKLSRMRAQLNNASQGKPF